MALETGNYINDLDQTYPTGTDTISEGDGHLQLIKKVLNRFSQTCADHGRTDMVNSVMAFLHTLDHQAKSLPKSMQSK